MTHPIPTADARAEAIDARVREHGLAVSWDPDHSGITIEVGSASVFVAPEGSSEMALQAWCDGDHEDGADLATPDACRRVADWLVAHRHHDEA